MCIRDRATGCAIVLIGHLNKAAGTQSTYRGLGSIDITAAVRSLLFIGKLKDSPTTKMCIRDRWAFTQRHAIYNAKDKL